MRSDAGSAPSSLNWTSNTQGETGQLFLFLSNQQSNINNQHLKINNQQSMFVHFLQSVLFSFQVYADAEPSYGLFTIDFNEWSFSQLNH